MRYVGRIITTSKIEGLSDFIELTKDGSSIKDGNAKIPTIIIGHKNAENILGRPLKMSEKKIGENLYWTFSKRERRIEYEPDMDKFENTVSNFLMKFCQYEYIDAITADNERKGKIRELLTDGTHRKIVYVTDSMYYVYCPSENKTYGLSKDVLSFVGVKPETVEEKFRKQSANIITISDVPDTKIAKSKFVIPLLYYLATF